MISNTQDAIAAGFAYRAYAPLADRIAVRNAAGSPADVMANGVTVQGANGPETLTFAAADLWLLFMIGYVTGL